MLTFKKRYDTSDRLWPLPEQTHPDGIANLFSMDILNTRGASQAYIAFLLAITGFDAKYNGTYRETRGRRNLSVGTRNSFVHVWRQCLPPISADNGDTGYAWDDYISPHRGLVRSRAESIKTPFMLFAHSTAEEIAAVARRPEQLWDILTDGMRGGHIVYQYDTEDVLLHLLSWVHPHIAHEGSNLIAHPQHTGVPGAYEMLYTYNGMLPVARVRILFNESAATRLHDRGYYGNHAYVISPTGPWPFAVFVDHIAPTTVIARDTSAAYMRALTVFSNTIGAIAKSCINHSSYYGICAAETDYPSGLPHSTYAWPLPALSPAYNYQGRHVAGIVRNLSSVYGVRDMNERDAEHLVYRHHKKLAPYRQMPVPLIVTSPADGRLMDRSILDYPNAQVYFQEWAEHGKLKVMRGGDVRDVSLPVTNYMLDYTDGLLWLSNAINENIFLRILDGTIVWPFGAGAQAVGYRYKPVARFGGMLL